MNAVAVSAVVFCACACIGADVSWRGGDGDWFDAGKWSTDAVPAADDAVTIAGGTVTLTGVTERVASLALSGAGAVLVFAEPVRAAPCDLVTTLHADSIVLSGGATVTHAANDMTVADYLAMADESRAWLMDARVNIVCGTLSIDADSRIDTDGKGYHLEAGDTKCGAPGPGGDTTNATGTVGVSWDNGTAAAYLCAGGHGGWGAGTHWRVIDFSPRYSTACTACARGSCAPRRGAGGARLSLP